jgi:magnesium transporter
VDGQPVAWPATLAETFQRLVRQPDSMAWIGLYRPAEDELMSAAQQLELHELAVEDAVTARQRPKLERYGDTLFVVLRAARYRDDTEEVDFGELHLFVGPNFVLTVRHSEAPDLAVVRQRVEDEPDVLRLGPEAGGEGTHGQRREAVLGDQGECCGPAADQADRHAEPPETTPRSPRSAAA